LPARNELELHDLQSPILVLADKVQRLNPAEWSSGDVFLAALEKASELRGIILPLELAASGTKRQQLWGIDLLNWLRWSAKEPVCDVPILAVAWQSLASVLRKRPNLLLVAEGCRFARLPTQDEITSFLNAARSRSGSLETCSRTVREKVARVGVAEAARISHHDLANDYYAAYRLWAAYRFALGQIKSPSTNLQAESDRARLENEKLDCVKQTRIKMKQPWFKQYQASLSEVEIPAYPHFGLPESLLRRHVERGLPPTTRILLVDDEFDRGMAEVLLQVLFRQSRFTKTVAGEWVYSESVADGAFKARLVCVKDASLARNWLIKWGELPVDDPTSITTSWKRWLENWIKELGWKDFPPPGLSAESILERDRTAFAAAWGKALPLDDDVASPKKMTTIVLLDLRLSREKSERTYVTRELPSVKLRSDIKAHKGDLPVILFTASRQATNYAEIMSDAGPIDGWLCKEAPDIPEDDKNSRNALDYLLGRIYLYSTVGSWYRETMDWSPEKKSEYSAMYDDPKREEYLAVVTENADSLYELAESGNFAKRAGERPFWGVIQELVDYPEPYTRLIQRLVARRVVIASLLFTAEVKDSLPKWNVEKFAGLIRGAKIAETAKYPSDVVNFRRDLWLASYREEELLGLLLREEHAWLLRKFASTPMHAILGRAIPLSTETARPSQASSVGQRGQFSTIPSPRGSREKGEHATVKPQQKTRSSAVRKPQRSRTKK